MVIIAHRGASGTEPENTMRAFQRAAQLGVNWIELDVRLTKDKVPVVIHDKSVNRTTDGKGLVAEMNYDDVRLLNAGMGERVPSLSEAIEFCSSLSIKIVIEIKSDDAVEEVLRQVNEFSYKDHVIISSFSKYVVREVKRHDNKIQTGIITYGLLLGSNSWASLAQSAHAQFVHVFSSAISVKRIEKAHSAGIKVWAWTLNDVKRAGSLRKKGVDGIFTDFPERFV